MVQVIHWPPFCHDVGPDLPNARVARILNYLGNPHLQLKNVFHITGTNGKGSTANYIANILLSEGHKVNLYTSPHIYHYNERIKMNGIMISDERLLFFLDRVRWACEDLDIMPTMFEATTVVAFCAFAESNADFNVLEVGMGGRIDATNVFDDFNGNLRVIFTPIDVDHAKFLGHTAEENAYEKSFLIKEGHPVIIAPQLYRSVENLLINVAKRHGCISYSHNREYEFGMDDDENDVLLSIDGENMMFAAPKLLGDHQIVNAVTAVVSIVALRNPFGIPDRSLSAGISSTFWPVRLERVLDDRVISLFSNMTNCNIYIDGAHNVSGAMAVANFVQKLHDVKKYFIVGRSRDVDNSAFLAQFVNLADLVVAIKVQMEPLSEPASRIYTSGIELGLNMSKAENLLDALMEVHQFHCNNYGFDIGCIVIICGSLYLARDLHCLSP